MNVIVDRFTIYSGNDYHYLLNRVDNVQIFVDTFCTFKSSECLRLPTTSTCKIACYIHLKEASTCITFTPNGMITCIRPMYIYFFVN